MLRFARREFRSVIQGIEREQNLSWDPVKKNSFDPDAFPIWKQYVNEQVSLYNPSKQLWIQPAQVSIRERLVRGSCIVQLADNTEEAGARKKFEYFSQARKHRSAGAKDAVEAIQRHMDEQTEDLFWCVFTTKAAYERYYQSYLQHRHEVSQRKSKMWHKGTALVLPAHVERVMRLHNDKMKAFGMSPETKLWPPSIGWHPRISEMVSLQLMVDFVSGRLNVDLRCQEELDALSVGLEVDWIRYTDGFPSANRNMADEGGWFADHLRKLWCSGTSDPILGAVWKGTEDAYYSLYENGHAREPEVSIRSISFPMFGTRLNLRVRRPLLSMAGDNKWLGEAAGTVTGSGTCRGHDRDPIPTHLFRHLKYLRLCTYHGKMRWRLRMLVAAADAAADALDDYGALLDRSTLVSVLTEKGLYRSKLKREEENALIRKRAGTSTYRDVLENWDLVKPKLETALETLRKSIGVVSMPLGYGNNPVALHEIAVSAAEILADPSEYRPAGFAVHYPADTSSPHASGVLTGPEIADLKVLLKIDSLTSPHPLLDRYEADALEELLRYPQNLLRKGGHSLKNTASSFALGHDINNRNKQFIHHVVLHNGIKALRSEPAILAAQDAKLLEDMGVDSYLNYVWARHRLKPFYIVAESFQFSRECIQKMAALIARSNLHNRMRGRPPVEQITVESETRMLWDGDNCKLFLEKAYTNDPAQIALEHGLTFCISELFDILSTVKQESLYFATQTASVFRAAELVASGSPEVVQYADDMKGERLHGTQTKVKETLRVRGQNGRSDDAIADSINKCYRVHLSKQMRLVEEGLAKLPLSETPSAYKRQKTVHEKLRDVNPWRNGGMLCPCVLCHHTSIHSAHSGGAQRGRGVTSNPDGALVCGPAAAPELDPPTQDGNAEVFPDREVDQPEEDTSNLAAEIRAITSSRHVTNTSTLSTRLYDKATDTFGGQQVTRDRAQLAVSNWEVVRKHISDNLGPEYIYQCGNCWLFGQPALAATLLAELKAQQIDVCEAVVSATYQNSALARPLYTLILEPEADEEDVSQQRESLPDPNDSSPQPRTEPRVPRAVIQICVAEGTVTISSASVSTDVQAAGVTVNIPRTVWRQYFQGACALETVVLSLTVNRCEPFIVCIGDVFPVNDCPACKNHSTDGDRDDTPQQLELDDPLGAGEKWKSSDWFATRLPCARKLVHSHIHHQFNLWTRANFDWERTVTGTSVHAALVKAVGKAWVEAWIGVEKKAVERLGAEAVTFLKENLRSMKGLEKKPKGSKTALEKQLMSAGGIKDASILQPGTRVEAIWCDKFGRQEMKNVRSRRGLTYRKVPTHPGWHKGTIAGLDRPTRLAWHISRRI